MTGLFSKVKLAPIFSSGKILLVASVLLAILCQPVIPAYAAGPVLTVTPITWNVIGLDSNNVNVGPNNFPVGARVCNTGDAVSNVTATFVWDDGGNLYNGDPYINLRSSSLNTISIASLAAGTASSPSCYDFYFEVSITRNSNAYDHTRRYHINVTATGLNTLSTPTPREIYVEHLISQNRNSVTDVKYGPNVSSLTSVTAGGTMSLVIGNTYTIELIGGTATQGYNQLEDFINFPNTIFQVLSVQSTYSADSSTFVANSSDKLYADACLWDSDPTSPTYRSCIGSDGKTGGSITTTYTVKIIGGAGTTQTLNTLIYDFSGSSYHYNSDFSTAARYAYISSPLTMTKSFSPVSITSGGASTLTITINNTNSSAVTGVSLTDPMPSGVTISGSATSSCGGISNSTGSITLTNATIPTTGCTIQATVTSSTNGTYTNTTDDLFINGSDTGTNATANLTVASQSGGSGICGLTLAQWTVPSTATNPPDTSGGNATTRASDVSTATVSASSPAGTAIDNKNGENDTYSWNTYGYKTGTSVSFVVDTSNYTNIQMNFYLLNASPSNGPTTITVTSDHGYSGSLAPPSTANWTSEGIDFSGNTNTSGNTTFTIAGSGAKNDNSGAGLEYDLITFTGCGAAQKPTITKAFSPATIGAGGTSQLQFTLINPNASGLTGVAFSDTLPSGVTVSGTPTTSQCGGTISNTSNTVTLTGGTIAASSNCTVTLNVTAASAGVYNNTSGFITSTESGTNTGSGGSASATLTVLAPPTISKSFSPNPIYADGTSTLTFTITNPNASSGLSGVGFTDVFPTTPGAMILASTTTTNSCGGSLTDNSGNPLSTSPASVGIQLSGGSLSAGGSCTVSVLTTASATGSYANTSGNVSAVISGVTYNGNTASDTLGVQTTHPGISVLKQVSTSASGPWDSTINVAAGQTIYYKITIENIGDVPLSPVSVTDTVNPLTDPSLNLSSCNWPSTLPVGTSTVDPTATCIVSATAQTTGTHSDTATAHGTYNSTVYDSNPASTATYVVTSLTLTKSLTSVNGNTFLTSFSAADDLLAYDYRVTNTGSTTLTGPVTVTDSNTTVSCPSGDLASGAYIDCTATYTVTAFDVSVGSVTNTAYATVSGVDSNRDSKTVYMNLPDLVVSKTNDTDGYASNGTPFHWTLKVSNNGPQDATFTTGGQTILSDQLPTTGASYGTLPLSLTIGSSTGITGTISCSIDTSELLTCTASGGSVTIGGTTGSFTIDVSVTPTATGSLVNSSAVVDPNNNVPESNEGNNTGSDAVTVSTASPTIAKSFNPTTIQSGGTSQITLTLSNSNGTDLTGANFTDTLANMSAVAGSVTGTCVGTTPGSLTAGATSLSFSGITIPANGSCTVIFSVTSSTVGTNPNQTSGVTTTQTPTAGSPSNTANLKVNAPTGAIDGTVFNDANADGTQDSGENGINGVTIKVYDSTGTTLIAATTTDASGHYTVNNLPPADYIVVEQDLNGYVSSTSNNVSVTVPSNGTAQADFGDYQLTGTSTNNISGTVFEDANANGTLDNGESVLSGVTVTLYDQSNNVVAATTTAVNGTYSFNNLPAGVYTVVETNPSGYISTTLDHVSVILSSGTNVVVNYGDQKNTATVIDPAVTKYGDPSNAQVGDLVTYTITVGNNGNTDALNVVLTDTKPAFLDIISVNVSPNKGFTVNISGNTFTIDFGTVTPTDFYTVTVLTRVNSLGKAPGGANNASITTSSLGDPVFNNAASATLTIPASSSGGGTKANALPSTGFAPGVITTIASEPANIYNTSTDLTIEIPALGVKTSIVGVPQSSGSWNITWLGNQVGYLDGTAFPTWSGNSVLTGHVYGANGLPGPFVNLHTLKWGNQVIIHFAGQRYIYEVRENKTVSPSDMSAFKHENRPWITLITCKDYNASTNTYAHRVEIGAVLVNIESDTSSSSAGR